MTSEDNMQIRKHLIDLLNALSSDPEGVRPVVNASVVRTLVNIALETDGPDAACLVDGYFFGGPEGVCVYDKAGDLFAELCGDNRLEPQTSLSH